MIYNLGIVAAIYGFPHSCLGSSLLCFYYGLRKIAIDNHIIVIYNLTSRSYFMDEII